MNRRIQSVSEEVEPKLSEADMLKQGLTERCSITHRTRASHCCDERIETTGGDYIKGHDDE